MVCLHQTSGDSGPVKLLPHRRRSRNRPQLVKSASGSTPVKQFFCKLRVFRLVQYAIAGGTGPGNRNEDKFLNKLTATGLAMVISFAIEDTGKGN